MVNSTIFYILSILSSVWLYFDFSASGYIIPVALIAIGWLFDYSKNNKQRKYNKSVTPYYENSYNDTIINNYKRYDDSYVASYGSSLSSLTAKKSDDEIFLEKCKEKGNVYETQIHELFLSLDGRYNLVDYEQRGFVRGYEDETIDLYYEFSGYNNKKLYIAVQCKNWDSNISLSNEYVKKFIYNSSKMSDGYVNALLILNDERSLADLTPTKNVIFLVIPSYNRIKRIGRENAILLLSKQLDIFSKQNQSFYYNIITSLLNSAIEGV